MQRPLSSGPPQGDSAAPPAHRRRTLPKAAPQKRKNARVNSPKSDVINRLPTVLDPSLREAPDLDAITARRQDHRWEQVPRVEVRELCGDLAQRSAVARNNNAKPTQIPRRRENEEGRYPGHPPSPPPATPKESRTCLPCLTVAPMHPIPRARPSSPASPRRK